MTLVTNNYSGVKVTFQATNPVNEENRQNLHSISLLYQKSFNMSLTDFDTLQLHLDTCHKIFGKNFSVVWLYNLEKGVCLLFLCEGSRQKSAGQLPSQILRDPYSISPIVILKFKVTANMNTYDYQWNAKTIKNHWLILKITFTMPKQLKIGKILDNCFRDRDFFLKMDHLWVQ